MRERPHQAMKRLIAACSLGALVVLLWRLRPAPLPELEPFDEPGGGFDWPWQPTTGNPFPSGTALTYFAVTNGTTRTTATARNDLWFNDGTEATW